MRVSHSCGLEPNLRAFEDTLPPCLPEGQGLCDPLTGLYLREHWEWLLQANFALARKTGGGATLLSAALDPAGAAGDEALRHFGHLLRTHLRATDIRGRRGTHTFGILLPDAGMDAALRLVERLHWLLDVQPLHPDRRLGATFGACSLGPGIRSPDAWLRRADQLLLQARRSGGDCVRSEPLARKHRGVQGAALR
ncbi:GGDEF domain-containing protein [Xylophilus sp. ASV27]|uniref:GGDEF domain-containing protein n=1 Tax=Xylophilus sp. ASV27 TaxID=2795129 RepID=UPI0018ECC230|nr:GGDEF domain-containing protein [Xylophilus sp. ASV27]